MDELVAIQPRDEPDLFPGPWNCNIRDVRMALDVEPGAEFTDGDMVYTLRALDETMEDFNVPRVQFDVLSASDQRRLASGSIGYGHTARPISQETSTTQADIALTS